MTNIVHDAATRHKSRAYSIVIFKDRDEWLALLLTVDDDSISFPAKAVGARIALHHNVETGRCDPSLPMLARGTGMSVRNVRRMLRMLEQAGWLIVGQSSGGRRAGDDYNSSSFELRVPVTRTDESALNPDKRVRVKEANPDNQGRLTRTSRVANPDTVVRQENSESNSEEENSEVDSPRLDLGDEESRRRRDLNPDTERRRLETLARNDRRRAEMQASFEAFWQHYPKKEAMVAAQAAYRGVISAKRATPEELLAGAMRYAAERSGQNQRYTKHASNWLKDGRWADEPAKPIEESTSFGHQFDQALADAQLIAARSGQ